jgi:hypothetical protein
MAEEGAGARSGAQAHINNSRAEMTFNRLAWVMREV